MAERVYDQARARRARRGWSASATTTRPSSWSSGSDGGHWVRSRFASACRCRAAAARSNRAPSTTQLLASPWFETVAADLDWVPVTDWAQSWTTDFLRWRLSRPDAGYVLHVTPEALAVSVAAHGPLKVQFAVLLKVFPRPGARLPAVGGADDLGRVPAPPRPALRLRGLQRARARDRGPVAAPVAAVAAEPRVQVARRDVARRARPSGSTPSSSSTWTRTDTTALDDARTDHLHPRPRGLRARRNSRARERDRPARARSARRARQSRARSSSSGSSQSSNPRS